MTFSVLDYYDSVLHEESVNFKYCQIVYGEFDTP